MPKEATEAARRTLKPLKLDKTRQARGRGKAAAATPDDLRKMANAPRERAPQPTARNCRRHVVPFAVAGRNEEMSELNDRHIRLVNEGLEVHVPSVKGRPARDVVLAYGEDLNTCPVRCWLAWQVTKLAGSAAVDGPTFLPVTQWGNSATRGHRRTAAAARWPAPRSTRG